LSAKRGELYEGIETESFDGRRLHELLSESLCRVEAASTAWRCWRRCAGLVAGEQLGRRAPPRFTSVAANGADIALCSIVEKPANFNHQSVTLQGTALGVKETTSHRGNDYTTFKLQDPSGWGATPHCRTAIKSAWTVYSRPNIIKAATLSITR